MGRGRGVSQHAIEQGCVYASMQLGRGCDGGVHPPDTPHTCQQVGGMHPTGMLSCFTGVCPQGGGVVCIHGVVCQGGLHPGGLHWGEGWADHPPGLRPGVGGWADIETKFGAR